jgi:polyphenol oxidase
MCPDNDKRMAARQNLQMVELPGDWTVGALPMLEALPGVRHAVSTRLGPGGASLAWDDPEGPSRRQGLGRALGAKQVASLRQVHGGVVVAAEEALASQIEADAMYTQREGLAVMGLSADCPIVLAADLETGAVGMAHASWRSTVARLTYKLIRAMCTECGSKPPQIVAGICPSAGPCCYEVGPDTVAAATKGLGEKAQRFFVQRDGRTLFDLWTANVQQMLEAGLCRHNIQVAGVCTICDGRFFSVRRDGPSTGRFGAMIARA